VEACFAKTRERGFPGRDFAYVAATGDADSVAGKTGIFYSMTCHAGGASRLFPETMSVLDTGSLYMWAMKLDGKGKVVAYKMTSQCASGMGQFLENIGHYLGITAVGERGRQVKEDEPFSTPPCPPSCYMLQNI
jgi:benzoyl-CoA reductase subunit D